MKTYLLTRSQLVKKPLPEVFSFFEDPANLEQITPPQLGFHILTPQPIQMGKGLLIDYTVRVLGWPVRWSSLISEYEPLKKFVDVQVKGPYSFWHHTHRFQERPQGTLIEDEVRYSLPFGFLGRVAHGLFVGRQLNEIFEYRKKVIAESFSRD